MMEKEVNCNACESEIIITVNNLFFKEEPKDTNINCPNCKKVVLIEKTDGWFFVRTKKEFIKEKLIDNRREVYKF